jgi:hypothetical protein
VWRARHKRSLADIVLIGDMGGALEVGHQRKGSMAAIRHAHRQLVGRDLLQDGSVDLDSGDYPYRACYRHRLRRG